MILCDKVFPDQRQKQEGANVAVTRRIDVRTVCGSPERDQCHLIAIWFEFEPLIFRQEVSESAPNSFVLFAGETLVLSFVIGIPRNGFDNLSKPRRPRICRLQNHDPVHLAF